MFLAPVAVFAGGFKFAAIFCDEGFDGPRDSFAERANCLALDVVGDFPQQIHIFGTV